MRKPSTSQSRFSRIRKYWKPATAGGAGGASIALFFEELLVFAGELLALLVLPLLVGIIFLYNLMVFKSTKPKPEDIKPERNS